MSDDRIRKLESIAFSMGELCDLWHKRFQELKEYEKNMGITMSLQRRGHLAFGLRLNVEITGC